MNLETTNPENCKSEGAKGSWFPGFLASRSITIDLPDRVTEYLDVVCATGIGKTREEIAAHLVEQGVWRFCGENMGFAVTSSDNKCQPHSET